VSEVPWLVLSLGITGEGFAGFQPPSPRTLDMFDRVALHRIGHGFQFCQHGVALFQPQLDRLDKPDSNRSRHDPSTRKPMLKPR
jgi:hypothetical protein